MLAHEQHRRPGCRGEWALEGDAGPELPVLAIRDVGQEAAGTLEDLAPDQYVPAIGEQVADQQAREEVAGRWAADAACIGERIGADGGDGVWGRFEGGEQA